MSQKNIYISEPIHPKAVERLKEYGNVVFRMDPPGEVDAVILRAEKITREMMERAPRLKVIGRHGVGMDNVDLAAARELGIPVVYTPMANANAVAELTFTLAVCLLKNICPAAAFYKGGGSGAEFPEPTARLRGRTVGIVGMGRIGTIVAGLFRNAFQARILAYQPSQSAEQLAALGAEKTASLEELVSRSDVVTISVPLCASTRNLFNRRVFDSFNRDAILINTARGGIVDEEALRDALAAGRLRAAAFDVLRDEPVPKGHPLLRLDNFIALPHMGANTEEAMYEMAMTVAEDVISVLEGREPLYPLPPDSYL